jgi:hypothetical protein
MSDIIERAEAFVTLDHHVTNFVGSVPIINELVAELKNTRAENDRLVSYIEEDCESHRQFTDLMTRIQAARERL